MTDAADAIIAAAADVCGSSRQRILGRARCRADNDARLLAMALAENVMRHMTLDQIGERFRRTRSSVAHARDAVRAARFRPFWRDAAIRLRPFGLVIDDIHG